jgi:hypothetical protein
VSSGYASPAYAESLSELGTPRFLPLSGGSIVERPIPETEHRDAMGPYPLFACRDWRALPADLEAVGDELVALSLVADPFGDYAASELESWFDVVVPFKEHFVADLSEPLARYVDPHHRRNAARASRELSIERCREPALRLLDDWDALYSNLVRRHHIRGVATFSRETFAKQLQVPGLVAFRAARGTDVVGMTLWYVDGNVAHYHLGAYSTSGYKLRASFGLFWCALEHFSKAGQRWGALGAASGVRPDADGGLARFKRGWSTATRVAYLCGRILDPGRYEHIAGMHAPGPTDYFPAYRCREFTSKED